MKNRRCFLKSSALSICGAPFISIPENCLNNLNSNEPLVRQREACETFFVRENTPITFNISKSRDNIFPVSLLTEELLPGSIIPVHKHINEDEYFFFLQGSGLITINDTAYPFAQGTTGFVPKDTWHGLKNTGTDKVIFSFGYSPAGFEGFFREIGTPKGQPFKPKSKEEFDAIAKKYGIMFK